MPSSLCRTTSCGHRWNRHLLLFSIHFHCPSVRVGTWLLVLRGADSSSHGHLPESTKAHLQGRHLFLLFCWRGTGFWGPRRLPCWLGGTGRPLLQGSHLGIPGGKLLLECEHLLLQCLLHCAAVRCPGKNPSLPPARGRWPAVTQDEVFILTQDIMSLQVIDTSDHDLQLTSSRGSAESLSLRGEVGHTGKATRTQVRPIICGICEH
jgi:hypothetical protein